MQAILSLQVMIFVLIFVGFLVKRWGLVSGEGQRNLTDLVIYLILPCNILNAFLTGADRSRISSFFYILLVGIAIQAISLLYGHLVFRRQPEGRRKCLQYGAVCNNGGFLGNPVVEVMYGSDALALASVYLIPLRIMMWSSGLAIFSGEKDRKTALRKAVTHPCILACLAGILLLITGLSLPEIILKPIRALGQCNTGLSMLIIGMILERIDLKSFLDRDTLIYSLHRLVLMPAMFFLLLRFLPLEEQVFKICVLLTAMPAGATTSILAEKYQMESEFATKMVITSTLLSLPTMMILCLILR